MPKLPFSAFVDLLSEYTDERLFDAVKPQVQNYAEHVFAHLNKGAAYEEIFKLANSESGGKSICPVSNPENAIERMGKGKDGKGNKYATSRIHAERFFYYFLFGCPDPTYAEKISSRLFRKSFYIKFADRLRRSGVPRPRHLPPQRVVRLGSLQLVTADQAGTRDLIQADFDLSIEADDGGMSAISALDWRAGLTNLHGRDAEKRQIVDWALNASKNEPRVMLLSGPGGSGKSKLAVEACRMLIDDHAWVGGFFPRVVREAEVFQGGSNGTIILIDYPEERTDRISEIIRGVEECSALDTNVCIVLVSREDRKAWQRACKLKFLRRFEELSLEHTQFLEMEHAVALAKDATETALHRLAMPPRRFFGIERWLSRDETHRNPLIALAAAVHAAIDPDAGFTLSGREVLLALAEIELQRVRSYSLRSIGEHSALERLIALSSLSEDGLTHSQITAIGQEELASSAPNLSFLRSVTETPFWRKDAPSSTARLQQLRPHRFAAAFFYVAFSLERQSFALTKLLPQVIETDTKVFGILLDRMACDLEYLDENAPANLIHSAMEILDAGKGVLSKLSLMTARTYSKHTAPFVEEMNRRWLDLGLLSDTFWEVGTHGSLASNIYSQGRHEEALDLARQAVSRLREIVLKPGANSLTEDTQWLFEHGRSGANGIAVIYTLSMILRHEGQLEEAYSHSEDAVFLAREFDRVPTAQSTYFLASALHNSVYLELELKRNMGAAARICEEAWSLLSRKFVDPHDGIPDLKEELRKLRSAILTVTENMTDELKSKPEIHHANSNRAPSGYPDKQ